MAIDPVTAGIDLVKTFANKFLSDKMSEAERKDLELKAEMFVASEARQEDSAFRSFVVSYEGEAKDYKDVPFVGPLILILRGVIRPVFTCLVAYLDYLYFTTSSALWSEDQSGLLKAINIIVLLFWFGERAVTNSGIVDKILTYKGKQ